MTTPIDGHQDQALANRQDAVPTAIGERRQQRSGRSSPQAHGRPERRRSIDGLSIGAPLTAAFIGGILVIENLAGADQPARGLDAPASDDDLLLSGEDGAAPDGEAASGGARTSADGGGDGVGEGGRAGDPEAAPVDNGALEDGGGGTGDGGAMPAIAAAASEAPLPGADDAGGSEASISFFDITIGDANGEAAVDPIVEDEVLRRDTQVGTPGDDVLNGTDGDDAISGGSGDDIIFGHGGRDLLNGNEGDDQLFGGAGDDILKGGAGNDILDGGADYDDLLGGSGDDILIVNNLHDVALDYAHPANSGIDTLVVRQGYADELAGTGIDAATFLFSEHLDLRTPLPQGLATKTQQVAAGIENVTLEGSANLDIFADALDNQLTGNSGDNVIYGDGGDDRLSGRAGNDQLFGGAGDDELFGGSGDDILEGGIGEDMLYGQAGDDLFMFGLNDSAIDTVFDHEGANRLKIQGITDQSVETSLLGDDLYLTVDGTPIAMVKDYVGHEDAIAGVDFGQGLRTVDSLMSNRPDFDDVLADAEARIEQAAANDLLSAHLHLTEPTILGDPRTDQRLDGTDGDDWLSGFDGKDILFGKAGNDILAGGDGIDDLRGGAGDDRYLFEKGESGIDKITDTEGRNLAEIKGYHAADIDGIMLGDDLAVLAKGEILFKVDDFASHEENFQGVQVGNRFIPTEDLLA